MSPPGDRPSERPQPADGPKMGGGESGGGGGGMSAGDLPGSHGLDKDPNTKNWATHPASDIPAKVGTPVCAAHGGTVHSTKDPHPGSTGGVYGDQVTIVSKNGAVQTFYTHIDANSELKDGQTVDAGTQIGTVAAWNGHPNDSHLHLGMSVRTEDGSYKGVDPANALNATDGSTNGRDVTVTDGGGYIVGNQMYAGPPPPDSDKGDKRPSDEPDIPAYMHH